MHRFPVDAPVARVIRAFERLGFELVRQNPDGTIAPLTMPNHPRLKSSTLRRILTQAGIAREDSLDAYEPV